MKTKLFILFALATLSLSAKEYHVATTGNDKNDGSLKSPFITINHAAQIAVAGDITIHAGTYREWVNPANGGESDSKRIVYRAAQGEKVEIKGSEKITGWKKDKNGLWKVTLPDSFFGSYNSCRDVIVGDWYWPNKRVFHTAEVFIGGKSLNEYETLDKVLELKGKVSGKEPALADYTWCCSSENGMTTIWANFFSKNPNKELSEISVRPTCFYPEKQGLNYITISGLEFSQAATQWAAPTAHQVGMIATHWNKCWIIENCLIHDSRCTGITLGKEKGTGHNLDTNDKRLDGTQHYIEVVFRTIRIGWDKKHIGSHIVRNNEIYNCGQAGICGSMGAAFSLIENNYIHQIYTKRAFNGAEMAGIKFHGAVDTRIIKNRIVDCGNGIWLDWMAQGTRVSGNLLYNNDMYDIFMEVNHGPTLLDNNLFLSPVSICTQSQGGALVHNLIAGYVCPFSDLNRFTPYFLPHSTDVAGYAAIYGGDYRFYNNIFISNCTQKIDWIGERGKNGLEAFNLMKSPVFVSGNAYYNISKPSKFDTLFVANHDVTKDFKIIEEGKNVYLEFAMEKTDVMPKTQLVTTSLLGKVKFPNQGFENTDGAPMQIDEDYFGNKRSSAPFPGPFEKYGNKKIKVW
jgi:hypothetical protein